MKSMTTSEKLIQLIQQNPNLPVVPMVNESVIQDDLYSWWMGNWSDCSIEYYFCDDEYLRVWIKSQDEDELLEQYANLYEDECADLPDDEFDRRRREWIENLAWNKAIIVWINN